MQRMIALLTSLLLALGLTAGAALAHHGPIVDGPPNNPHTLGLPQEFWEEGLEVGFILDDDGEFIPVPGVPDFFRPAALPDDTAGLPLNFPDAYWLVFRIGGDDDDLRALRLEEGEPAPEHGFLEAPDDFTAGDLIDPDTEASTAEGTDAGDFVWVQAYPHPHSLILHAGTERARCVDLANARDIRTPNQHNAMHIGQPGTRAFANAGHMIVPMTCEDLPF